MHIDSLEEALRVYMYLLGLILCENLIVNESFWEPNEVKKYLAIRQSFFKDIKEATFFLLTEDVLPSHLTSHLRNIPYQKDVLDIFHYILQTFRSLDLKKQDVPHPFLLRSLHIYRDLENGEMDSSDVVYFLKYLTSLDPPAKIKTFFNMVLKKVRFLGVIYVKPNPNPGRWFSLSSSEQQHIKSKLKEVNDKLSSPELKSEEFHFYFREKHSILLEAGISEPTVLKEEGLDISELVASESKKIADALVAYSKELVLDNIKEIESYIKTNNYRNISQNDLRKAKTVLSKIATLPTLLAYLEYMVEKKIFDVDTKKHLTVKIEKISQKNLAFQKHNQVQPISFEPISEDQFTSKHFTGNVLFPGDMPEEARHEFLGKVSRGISDLEYIFGKGFCGKMSKPLMFDFSQLTPDNAVFGAQASYTSYYKNQFQPIVRFGNFDGLLAHELSHYLDVVIASRLSKFKNPESSQYEGSEDLFGRTGVPLDVNYKYNKYDIPALSKYYEVVLNSPDYQRWMDLIPGFYHDYLDRAYKNVYGTDLYDSGDYHSLSQMRFKSQMPKELVSEVESLYKRAMGGDDRKSRYFYSGVEIWARMCEQYVYTKMAKKGITNPWLTQVTYDTEELPQAMDQGYFESYLEPVMDDLFSYLKGSKVLARRQLN